MSTNLLDIYIDETLFIYKGNELQLSLPVSRIRECTPRQQTCYLFNLKAMLTDQEVAIIKTANSFSCYTIQEKYRFDKYGINYDNDKIDSLLVLQKEV